ncbi:MAG: hypothetical protein WCO30_01830 [bacterium]
MSSLQSQATVAQVSKPNKSHTSLCLGFTAAEDNKPKKKVPSCPVQHYKEIVSRLRPDRHDHLDEEHSLVKTAKPGFVKRIVHRFSFKRS